MHRGNIYSFMDKQQLINLGSNVAAFLITKKIYDSIFKHHRYYSKVIDFSDNDFPGLKKKRYEFKNNRGQKLVGYIYYISEVSQDHLMVFSHGFGRGGHHQYLHLINYFASQGYFVFAYDATGNDESEGDDIRGFTQGYLDADKAISFVESLKEYRHLPLILCGHSWGAYSASNALHLHARVKGLIAFSGFNQATSIFKANGDIYSPTKNNEMFVNYVNDYERYLFGKDADSSAIESFKNSKAKIAIVHSNDDRTVPTKAGIDQYEVLFKDDPRFLFIRYEDRGHAAIYYSSEGRDYFNSFYRIYNEYAKKNKLNEKQKEEYAASILNRDKWRNLLDESLLDRILNFIDEN